jgi:hypothetical protein
MSSALRSFARNLRAGAGSQIAELYPGCFAMVMAKGMISNVMFLEGRLSSLGQCTQSDLISDKASRGATS